MIYFIQDSVSGAIKIGISKTPKARLATLQTAHAAPLALLGVMEGAKSEEQELHRRFAQIQGEWFEPTFELLRYISSNAIMAADCVPPIAVKRPEGDTRLEAPTRASIIWRLCIIRDIMILVAIWLVLAGFAVRLGYIMAILFMPLLEPLWPYGIRGAIIWAGITGCYALANRFTHRLKTAYATIGW